MAIYLDNAATSFPKPDSVYQAVDDCQRNRGGAFGRGAHSGSEQVRDIVQDCRRLAATLIDAPSLAHLVFTFNCTDSLNMVLQGLLQQGDRVITTALEHNSVLRPLHQLAADRGVVIRTIEFDPLTGIVDIDQYRRELADGNTALVAITHASNVTGSLQPIEELVDIGHAHEALVLLDAAQTVGHIPLSMRQLDVDFVATAGHKGLLGPLGTGILAMKAGLESRLRPYRSGGTGTASESPLQPDSMPQRFESGNLNVPGIAGLKAGVEWLQHQTLEHISEHTILLTRRLYDGLSALQNVQCFPAVQDDDLTDFATGIISFTVSGMDSRDVGMILDQSFQIHCRTGLHCAPLVHRVLGTESSGGTVRLSIGPFNTADDIDTTLDAIGQVAVSAV